MSNFQAHIKHLKVVQPALQSIDFASIAESSTGGGGVPRPYGRFKAARAGDGNATYVRLPPQPGSWQAKALPIAVTVLSDEDHAAALTATPPPGSAAAEARTASAASTSESAASSPAGHGASARRAASQPVTRTPSPSHPHPPSSASSQLRRTPVHNHLRGPIPATNPSSCSALRASQLLPPQLNGTGGTLASANLPSPRPLPDQSCCRRPGSGVHRSLVPVPPPEPHNPAAWFALPAATFLTDMPHVPGHLRLDNGYSISREFLQSGLNAGRQPLAAQPSGASMHSHASHASQAPHAAVRLEDKQQLWEALERGGAAQQGPVGPMGLRGVYVPLDKKVTPEELLALEAGGAGGLGQPGWGDGEAARGSTGLMGVGLPPEQSLPRKHVPPGW